MNEIRVEFHHRASSTMFSIYQSYVHNLSSINRQGHEDVYQQSSNRYCHQLKQQLNIIIKELLNATEGRFNLNELNKTLTYLAEEYENEFMQKIKSL